MNPLIIQLKKEHETLAALLSNVQKLGVNSTESKAVLIKAKSALLAHLKKEDHDLYPILKKAGEKDESINRQINNFGKDMEEISKFALSFFDNIEKDKYSPLEYGKNFGKLISLLSARISREENILYPIFEKCLIKG